jgi:hypothetical protein
VVRVTIPVTVPVSWAAAMPGDPSRRMRVKQQVASAANTADEFRLILKILVGTGLMRVRRERRAGNRY